FNVESEPELLALDQVAQQHGLRAPVAIRVNPDVDARTHAKIATGKSENKFGLDLAHVREVCRRAAALPGIELLGLAVHIGSPRAPSTSRRGRRAASSCRTRR